MDFFAKIVNGFLAVNYLTTNSIVDLRLGSEYTSDNDIVRFILQNLTLMVRW